MQKNLFVFGNLEVEIQGLQSFRLNSDGKRHTTINKILDAIGFVFLCAKSRRFILQSARKNECRIMCFKLQKAFERVER